MKNDVPLLIKRLVSVNEMVGSRRRFLEQTFGPLWTHSFGMEKLNVVYRSNDYGIFQIDGNKRFKNQDAADVLIQDDPYFMEESPGVMMYSIPEPRLCVFMLFAKSDRKIFSDDIPDGRNSSVRPPPINKVPNEDLQFDTISASVVLAYNNSEALAVYPPDSRYPTLIRWSGFEIQTVGNITISDGVYLITDYYSGRLWMVFASTIAVDMEATYKGYHCDISLQFFQPKALIEDWGEMKRIVLY